MWTSSKTQQSNKCTYFSNVSSASFNFVVVLDHYDKEYLTKLNNMCREKGVGFIAGGNLGLYGYTFVDFGDKHTILDGTGEQEIINHVFGITNEEEACVYIH